MAVFSPALPGKGAIFDTDELMWIQARHSIYSFKKKFLNEYGSRLILIIEHLLLIIFKGKVVIR
jgi:hypothetical protein